MRLLGTVQGQSKAQSFSAYLLTQKIEANVDQALGTPDSWEIWIRDEDALAKAKSEFERFQQDPNNAIYADAVRQANEILRDKQAKQKEAVRNIHTSRTMNSASSQVRRIPPATLTLTILCIVIGFLTNFGIRDPRAQMANSITDELMFVSMVDYTNGNENPAASIMKGEIWRIVTPMFLHGNLFHLALNIIMLVQLGKITERLVGTGRFTLMILVIAIASGLLQGLVPESPFGVEAIGGSPFFVGISGVVFGIFGLLWILSTLKPEIGFMMHPMNVVILLLWLCIGFIWRSPSFPIANLCHLGGLLAGMFFGWLLAQGATNKLRS
jgi:GlpG protein